MAFPKSLLEEVHVTLRTQYFDWTADPVQTVMPSRLLAWKYHGFCSASLRIRAEIQIMSMLTGLFWHVEHDTFYKPHDPDLRGAAKKLTMKSHINHIYAAFEELEAALEPEQRGAAQPA